MPFSFSSLNHHIYLPVINIKYVLENKIIIIVRISHFMSSLQGRSKDVYFTMIVPNLVFSSVVKLHSNSTIQLNMTLTCFILIHPLSISRCTVDHLTVSPRNAPSPIIIQQTESTCSSAHVPNFMFCSCLPKCCPQPHPETTTK